MLKKFPIFHYGRQIIKLILYKPSLRDRGLGEVQNGEAKVKVQDSQQCYTKLKSHSDNEYEIIFIQLILRKLLMEMK